jgi:hypothetical protein
MRAFVVDLDLDLVLTQTSLDPTPRKSKFASCCTSQFRACKVCTSSLSFLHFSERFGRSCEYANHYFLPFFLPTIFFSRKTKNEKRKRKKSTKGTSTFVTTTIVAFEMINCTHLFQLKSDKRKLDRLHTRGFAITTEF